jgi:hypothetical protein
MQVSLGLYLCFGISFGQKKETLKEEGKTGRDLTL